MKGLDDLNGLKAVMQAADDAGAAIRTYVPGYPITDLAAGLNAEISINEKVALEIALGASATGLRSMVVVKQVGMNALADPLVISATHNIGSGLVLIAGDDLGPRGSQVEMDSRFYGPLAKLPLLDPRDPENLYASILEAYSLSEGLRVPVIVRVTAPLLAEEGPHISSRPAPGTGQRFRRLDMELTMRGLNQRHHEKTMARAAEAAFSSPLNRLQKCLGGVGIIASGWPAALAEGLGISGLYLTYVNPLPWGLIRKFLDDHQTILVAEEPEPFIESMLGGLEKVKGKLTCHLPRGELKRDDIIQAVQALKTDGDAPCKAAREYETVAGRGHAGVCEDCPFASLFYALRDLDVPVAGDAGCSIRASRLPYQSVDVVYGLGSSIGVASGFKAKGIALVGDYALAHSGLQGLINALWQKRDLLVVVLKNDVAAMTGGQMVPDLNTLLEGLMPVRYLDLLGSVQEAELVLREELIRKGPSVIVARGICPRYASDLSNH
ncbi:thiamine pyrophosphate-dependent enzyme [Methanothrix sp.]|uniref:thiamine pyrophosphate-dependent enzyme n=1 Tax=Methanothrix sp. TaxID=90426 RepID=UPI0032980A30